MASMIWAMSNCREMVIKTVKAYSIGDENYAAQLIPEERSPSTRAEVPLRTQPNHDKTRN